MWKETKLIVLFLWVLFDTVCFIYAKISILLKKKKKKERCVLLPLPPHNGHLHTTGTFLCSQSGCIQKLLTFGQMNHKFNEETWVPWYNAKTTTTATKSPSLAMFSNYGYRHSVTISILYLRDSDLLPPANRQPCRTQVAAQDRIKTHKSYLWVGLRFTSKRKHGILLEGKRYNWHTAALYSKWSFTLRDNDA